LGNDDPGSVKLQDSGDHGREPIPEYAVVRAGKHGHIDRVTQPLACPYFLETPGSRKKGAPILMERDRENPRLSVKRRLDAVSVVGVYVQIKNAITSL
jgi:hypothetical protein